LIHVVLNTDPAVEESTSLSDSTTEKMAVSRRSECPVCAEKICPVYADDISGPSRTETSPSSLPSSRRAKNGFILSNRLSSALSFAFLFSTAILTVLGRRSEISGLVICATFWNLVGLHNIVDSVTILVLGSVTILVLVTSWTPDNLPGLLLACSCWMTMVEYYKNWINLPKTHSHTTILLPSFIAITSSVILFSRLYNLRANMKLFYSQNAILSIFLFVPVVLFKIAWFMIGLVLVCTKLDALNVVWYSWFIVWSGNGELELESSHYKAVDVDALIWSVVIHGLTYSPALLIVQLIGEPGRQGPWPFEAEESVLISCFSLALAGLISTCGIGWYIVLELYPKVGKVEGKFWETMCTLIWTRNKALELGFDDERAYSSAGLALVYTLPHKRYMELYHDLYF